MYVYKSARTNLYFAGESSEPVHPKQGVRQGDPLSSTLFLLVLDFVLRQLPDTYGALLSEAGPRISYIAYADDLLLLARDSNCLQTLLNMLHTLLPPKGLAVNTTKSLVFSWVADKKHKKVLLDEKCIFTIGNQPLRALKFKDTSKYLGVMFTPDGRSSTMPNVSADLETLKNAPLKPQQKCYFLRTSLLPLYYHPLILGRLNAGFLSKIDAKVRKFLRDALHLPHDFPTSAFYAKVKDGGMGITC